MNSDASPTHSPGTWRSADLSLEQTGLLLSIWIAEWLFVQAPYAAPHAPAAVFVFLVTCVCVRNMRWIAALSTAASLYFRWTAPSGLSADQIWIQWSPISAILSGHNLYAASEQMGYTMAAYLPMGNLAGGSLIALGLHHYWNFWHAAVVALWLLPFLRSPSYTTLLIFSVPAFYFPLSYYTGTGGTVEISAALTAATVFLLRTRQYLAGTVIAAFTISFRQQAVPMLPFLLLLLHRDNRRRHAVLLLVLVFLWCGIYILADFPGAVEGSFRLPGQEGAELWLHRLGTGQNLNLGSIALALGVPEVTVWRDMATAYALLGIGGMITCFWFAARTGSRDRILALALLSTLALLTLARGYTLAVYLVGALAPFAVFFAEQHGGGPGLARRYVTRGLTAALVWFGMLPLALLATARLRTQPPAVDAPLAINAVWSIEDAGRRVPLPMLDGTPAGMSYLRLNRSLQIDLAEPAPVRSIRLSGPVRPAYWTDGQLLYMPQSSHIYGALTELEILRRSPGQDFQSGGTYRLASTYAAFPVTLEFGQVRTIDSIRIIPIRSYGASPEWMLGRLELFR